MQDLLEQFPTRDTSVEQIYRSFIYQPERVSVSSRQTVDTPVLRFNYANPNEGLTYSEFSCELRSPLLKIKSLELLRGTIPNIVPSLPNSQTIFFYYRIPTLGAPDYEPDYENGLVAANIRMIRLQPTSSPFSNPDIFQNPAIYGFNRTFEDYPDLVNELNKAALSDPLEDELTDAFYIPGDITFEYNQILNKIRVKGNNANTVGNVPQYYYLNVGYKDPNLQLFYAALLAQMQPGLSPTPVQTAFPVNFPYTLNRRLGFLFNGVYDLNTTVPLEVSTTLLLNTQVFPASPEAPPTPSTLVYKTAEGYADLVHTANVFLYCDIVGGSTQDADVDERLLAVIPIDTANLGVAFPESKIVCPLTKISDTVYQLRFSMRTDTGEPFLLPINAYVNLELKLSYN